MRRYLIVSAFSFSAAVGCGRSSLLLSDAVDAEGSAPRRHAATTFDGGSWRDDTRDDRGLDASVPPDGGADLDASTADGATPDDDCAAGDAGRVLGSAVLGTQADVDALRGITEVTGPLQIGGQGGSDIVSLQALSCLRTAHSLVVALNPDLVSLAGLEGLTGFASELQIGGNRLLMDLGALRNVDEVGGKLEIAGNPSLQRLDGLGGLRRVGADLRLHDNASLQDVTALHGATRLAGTLGVWANPMLTRCAAADLARALATRCTAPQDGQTVCTDVCTCSGNDNAVACDQPWLRQFARAGYSKALGVDLDSLGNAVVVGYSFGAVQGAGPAQGGTDMFVVKVSGTDGAPIWTTQLASPEDDDAYGVRVDGHDDVLVVGKTAGALGGAGAGEDDGFVAKLSGVDGRTLWARHIASPAYDYVIAVDVDGDDLLVAGGTAGVLDPQGDAPGHDAFIARLRGADGDVLWLRQVGTDDAEGALALRLDGAGSVYMAGSWNTLMDRDGWISKHSSATGAMLWTQRVATAGYDMVTSVAIGPTGDPLVAGDTDGPLDGPAPMGGVGSDAHAFVRRLAAVDGQRVWGRQSIDTPYDSPVVARVGAGGEVVLGGAVVGDLGGQVSQGGADGFVQVVDWEDGAAASTVLLGGPEDDFIADLRIAAPGVYVVTGYTWGSIDGRQGPQDGQRPDAFVAKIVTLPAMSR